MEQSHNPASDKAERNISKDDSRKNQVSTSEPVSMEQTERQQLLAQWENEKQLIACDLHDDLIQVLVGSTMKLESIPLEQDVTTQKTKDKIVDVQVHLRDAVRRLRELIGCLSAASIEQGLMRQQLDDLISGLSNEQQQISFHFDDQIDELNPALAGSVYYIIREGLHNAQRHAEGDAIWISVEMKADVWEITVIDNGQGIPIGTLDNDALDNDALDNEGFGLRGMRLRARVFGGIFKVVSSCVDQEAFNHLVASNRDAHVGFPESQRFRSGTGLIASIPQA